MTSTTHLPEWPNSTTIIPPNAGKDAEVQELIFLAAGNAK
jgi:hypothetical protein